MVCGHSGVPVLVPTRGSVGRSPRIAATVLEWRIAGRWPGPGRHASALMGLMMLAAFLSLAGMPPFGGFVAKVFVFAAGVQANYTWLVVVGILNSIIGVYYYLNVLKYVYLYRMEGENEEQHPVPLTRPYTIALVVLAIGVILVGTVFAPWFSWSDAAALNLF